MDGRSLIEALQTGLKGEIAFRQKEEENIKIKEYLSSRTKRIAKIIPEFMLSFNDRFRFRWDLFITALTIYNCFYIPFEIAFEP